MSSYKLPKGFLASGIHCGIKKKRKDLALFYSGKACKVASLFTTNVVKAAPVLLALKQLKKVSTFRGVVVNSGNANCMTGEQGIRNAEKMSRAVTKLLKLPESTILVSSTGVIGRPLPMKSILDGMSNLAARLSSSGLADAASAIMTTDNFCKCVSTTLEISGKTVTITGVAKGAGMIKPCMATMLAYIFTDANISQKALQKALKISVGDSFNAITVDGDMSTNDTVILFANGLAANTQIREKEKNFKHFLASLHMICKTLAKMIVEDGEGASKFVEVHVKGARSRRDAECAAESIADSLLVKCAVLGASPNWGRIASSVGSSGVNFNPNKMEIILDGVTFFKHGKALGIDKSKRQAVFKRKDVSITCDLHMGRGNATMYTCDISKKYITLNAHYST